LRVAAHWKAFNGLYLNIRSQVHQKIIASAVACPNQQRAILASLDA
jgi:ribose 1,5-bisphosphokinase PhnN